MRFIKLFLMGMAAARAQPQPSSLTQENRSPFLSIPNASEDLRFESQLPPFEAKDTSGRTWRLEDLRGKLTLIYVWGTFEARAVDAHPATIREVIPGLSDLPEVQRFYARARQTKNLQVLTFCADYDYTHVSDYMKEKGYSFPVIADWVLLKKLFPKRDQPYWVIGREARLSSPIRAWSLGRVLYEMERSAAR